MKQGETLALNERLMLSLVSTGVSDIDIITFFFVYLIDDMFDACSDEIHVRL